MAKTKIADVIVPTVFAPYALEKAVELSEFARAGIIGLDPFFDELANGGGKSVEMPFWKEITGDSEVLNDSADLTVDRIQTGQDAAAIHNRGKAWGANDLAKWLSGDDPAGQIAAGVGGFWARDMQSMLLDVLDGLFDNAAGVLRTTHRLNIYSDVASGSITDAMRLTAHFDGLPQNCRSIHAASNLSKPSPSSSTAP